ncbi:DUF4192 domain-containing protein [Nakamurella lactea]|uniref:DUF4192 domain-containing protein n=1 Tax=Nakamurella lactea TaxID=459515 RepID=UPI0003FCAD00|nr:DUF4192 domain-containing protein [Nakamurella lactea]
MTTTAREEAISVTESVDLIPMVPHLLGFAPQQSLVVMCFRGKRLGPVMRVDLPPAESAADISEYLALQAQQHGDRVVVLAYSDRKEASAILRVLLDRMLEDLPVIDAAVVAGNRVSFLPDPRGRVADPVQLPSTGPAAQRLAAESAWHGRGVLPTRQAVAASIAPPTADGLRRGEQAIAAARDELAPLALRSLQWLAARADITLDLSLAAMDRDCRVPANCAAGLALLAQTPAVRDLMIAAMLGERHRPWVPMLVDALAQLPAEESIDLSVMLAVMAYRAGDGALGQIAVDRAVRVDPEHRLAGLMLAIMEAGLPPSGLDDLAGLAAPASWPLDDEWGQELDDEWDDEWDEEWDGRWNGRSADESDQEAN